jgi:hypothetical protein
MRLQEVMRQNEAAKRQIVRDRMEADLDAFEARCNPPRLLLQRGLPCPI